MVEIERIEIFDFQSHHRTVLEPAPAGQLTVIAGPSDSGKTAIIRALRWLYYNTPQGTDFINVKTNTAKIAITFTDGRQVTRERHRKNYNRYNIFEGEKWHTYEGFGAGVPLEVQEVTGVRPVTIGDLELNLNLAEQLDGPFLGKSVSAGARAKVLGKLAGTEEIDYAQKQLNTDLYRRRQEEKALAAEIAGLEEQIKEFDYLPALAERIEALDQVVAKIKAARECRQKLAGAREQLRQVNSEMEAAQTMISRWRHVELAEYTVAGAEKATAGAGGLKRAKVRLQAAEEGMRQSAGIIERWRGLEEAKAKAAEASEHIGRRQSLAGLKATLKATLENIETAAGIKDRWAGTENADELTSEAEQINRRRATVSRLGGSLKHTEAAIQTSEQARIRWAGAEEAEKLAAAVAVDMARREKLSGLESLLRQVKDAITLAERTRRRWVKTPEAESLLQEAASAQAQQGKIIELAAKLRQVDGEARRARGAAVLWEQRVGDLEGAYKDELLAAGRCPLCGNDIKIEKLKEVV
ncbi:MAG: AAA family ATPase [Peptococcaceae bacterium]|nr:AAA family ATPase [Peptococcaceae bacterium]